MLVFSSRWQPAGDDDEDDDDRRRGEAKRIRIIGWGLGDGDSGS